LVSGKSLQQYHPFAQGPFRILLWASSNHPQLIVLAISLGYLGSFLLFALAITTHNYLDQPDGTV
jgi:hypothetical protein